MIAVLALSGSAHAGPHPYDVDTLEGVEAAMHEIDGWSRIDPACVEWMEGPLARVVLVGAFLDDYGCAPAGYFVDGAYVPTREQSAPALASAGWSDPARREALAVAWADVLGPLPLQRPRHRVRADGSVVVRGWREEPPGMTPVEVRRYERHVFSVSGELSTRILATRATRL